MFQASKVSESLWNTWGGGSHGEFSLKAAFCAEGFRQSYLVIHVFMLFMAPREKMNSSTPIGQSDWTVLSA
jgi:hypothetical protein